MTGGLHTGKWGSRSRLCPSGISASWRAGCHLQRSCFPCWAGAPRCVFVASCQGPAVGGPEPHPEGHCREVPAHRRPQGRGRGTTQGRNNTVGKTGILWVLGHFLGLTEPRRGHVTASRLTRVSYIPRSCRCKPQWSCCWWRSEKESEVFMGRLRVRTHYTERTGRLRSGGV